MTGTRRRWLGGVLVVVLVAAVAVGLALRTRDVDGSGSVARGTPGAPAAVRISAKGGIELAAQTFTPSGSGDHALLVMPVPFGLAGSAYNRLAGELARHGYQIVTYLQRGFHASQGNVDFAGPATQGDVSTVISWALAHTAANPKAIGMLGLSYGGGMSLLAAARDPRIRAVAALHAWTDLDNAFDPNNTASTAAMSILVRTAGRRIDSSIAPMTRALGTSGFGAALGKIAPQRSPQSYLAQLNRNKPAIFLANALEDSYFGPAQAVRFMNGLTGPKRLELAPGDHGTLAYGPGNRSSPIPDAVSWLDHYLRGIPNGVDKWQPLQLTDVTTGATASFPSWPGTGQAVALGQPNTAANVGAQQAWTAPLPGNSDSGADIGPFQLDASTYIPPAANVQAWKAGSYLSWTAPTQASALTLAGAPTVHVSVASTASSATLFAYLYEAAPSGAAQLITAEPYTATGLTPGSARAVSIALQPTAWTMRPGDHLVLVLDTADTRYTTETPASATVTLSSTAADPATITVPAV